jgi:hypothetical protein
MTSHGWNIDRKQIPDQMNIQKSVGLVATCLSTLVSSNDFETSMVQC